MKYLLTLLTIFLIFTSKTAYCQYATTLAAGLNQLSGSKGTIDVELLSEIVASKQNELKKEIVKSFILRNIGNSNFTFYNYTYNILDVLLNERNKQTITKRTMEYTSNLALVYAFAEYFLQTEWNSKTNDSAFVSVMNYMLTDLRYLSVNEQMKWMQKLNDKTFKPNFRPGLLFSLKSGSAEELEKIRKDINETLMQLNKAGDSFDCELYAKHYPTHIEMLLLAKAIRVYSSAYEKDFKTAFSTENERDIKIIKPLNASPFQIDSIVLAKLLSFEPILRDWDKFVEQISKVDNKYLKFRELTQEKNYCFKNKTLFNFDSYENSQYNDIFQSANLIEHLHKYNIFKSLNSKKNQFDVFCKYEQKQSKIDGFAKIRNDKNGQTIEYDVLSKPYIDSLQTLGTLNAKKTAKIVSSFGYPQISKNKVLKDSNIFAKYHITGTPDYQRTKTFFNEIVIEEKYKMKNYAISDSIKAFLNNQENVSSGELKSLYENVNHAIELIDEHLEARKNANHIGDVYSDYLRIENQLKMQMQGDSTKFLKNVERLGKELETIKTQKTPNFYNALRERLILLGIELDNELKRNNKIEKSEYGWLKNLTNYRIVENRLTEYYNYSDLKQKISALYQDSFYKNKLNHYQQIKENFIYFQLTELFGQFDNYITAHGLYKDFLKNKASYELLKKVNFYGKTIKMDSLDLMIEMDEFYCKLQIFNELNNVLDKSSKQLNKTKLKAKKNETSDEIPSLNLILVDMIFDICKNNKDILNRGFMNQPISVSNDDYLKQNAFRAVQYSDPTFYNVLQPLYQSMNERLSTLFQFYQLIKEMNLYNGQNIYNLKESYREKIINSLPDSANENENQVLGKSKRQIRIIKDNYLHIDSAINTFKINMEAMPTENSMAAPDTFLYSPHLEKIHKYLINTNIDLVYNRNSIVPFDQLKTSFNSCLNNSDYINSRFFAAKIDSFLQNHKTELLDWVIEQSNFKETSVDVFSKSFKGFNPESLAATDQLKLEYYVSTIKAIEKKDNEVITFSYLAMVRDTIIPDLTVVNAKYRSKRRESEKYQNLNIESLENLKNWGYYNEINKFIKSGKKMPSDMIIHSKEFIEIISRLNQLDRVETYEYILRVLADAGNTYKKQESIGSFNMLVNNTLNYISVDNRNNRLNFDIESLIMLLYEKYEKKQNQPISLYFSIGLNQNIFIPKATFREDGKEVKVSSFAFAAEKIGVKLIPFECMNRRLIRDQRSLSGANISGYPIVNDYHLIVYASGLLYNIVNSTTNRQFKYPVFGSGFGITFYNSFDINLTWSVPITDKPFTYSMLSLSFDIKISEYLAALYKRQKK